MPLILIVGIFVVALQVMALRQRSVMGDKKSAVEYSEEETVARREAMLKRMFSTPPQHRTAKGEKANPPKKRGRPKKASQA